MKFFIDGEGVTMQVWQLGMRGMEEEMISEKRNTRRFTSRIGIVSSDEDGLNFGFITDLSRSGAYLETEKILQVGTPFSFVLSNAKARALIRSKVVRVRDAFFHGGKSGIGVEFDNLDGMAKMVRDDLLLYLMNLRFQEFWSDAA